MRGMSLKKKDRLSEFYGAAFLLFLFLCLWLCQTVKAGEENVTGEGVPACQGFWKDMDGDLYYYDRNGKKVTESFVSIVDREGEYCYYFEKDGRAAKGLTEIAQREWYYFEESGIMLTSGIKVLESKTWYFGEDGKADWVLERFE